MTFPKAQRLEIEPLAYIHAAARSIAESETFPSSGERDDYYMTTLHRLLVEYSTTSRLAEKTEYERFVLESSIFLSYLEGSSLSDLAVRFHRTETWMVDLRNKAYRQFIRWNHDKDKPTAWMRKLLAIPRLKILSKLDYSEGLVTTRRSFRALVVSENH
jgi:hypothetical protein